MDLMKYVIPTDDKVKMMKHIAENECIHEEAFYLNGGEALKPTITSLKASWLIKNNEAGQLCLTPLGHQWLNAYQAKA